ncbi:cytidine/deoxycytidylate deaminase family protein [Candidatus Roizmanbacteria bacterium]|nr:cytidine/deoxycytidylate deaminase family protein [Candidatus Roizmanbacteria bacterium]
MSRPNRPSWDTYFLNLAHVVKDRSNCLRMSVGVVIVRDKHIIATGYNGTPAGIKNCIDGGCERCLHREKNILKENERKDLCICVHSEQNALLQSAYHGVSTKGAILYSTTSPCLQCAKAIINSGISSVVYEGEHQDDLGLKLLQSAHVEVRQFKND